MCAPTAGTSNIHIHIYLCMSYICHTCLATYHIVIEDLHGDAAAAAAASATADWRYILERLYKEQELHKLCKLQQSLLLLRLSLTFTAMFLI